MHTENPFREDRHSERLRALRASGLLDSTAGDGYKDLVRLASEVSGTPMAAIALLGEDSERLLCAVGLEAVRLPAGAGLCPQVVSADRPLVVADARSDSHLAGNPLVEGPPKLRGLAGLPVHMGHLSLGALCVLDVRPRPDLADHLGSLRIIARQIDRLIELGWRRGRSGPPVPSELDRMAAMVETPEDFAVVLGPLAQPAWVIDARTMRFLEVNEAAVQTYGFSREEFRRLAFSDLRPTPDPLVVPGSKVDLSDSARCAGAGLAELWSGRAFVHRCRGGEVVLTRLSLTETDFAGRPALLVVAAEVDAEPGALADLPGARDELTGFGSTRGLRITIEKLLGSVEPLSLVLIDMDRLGVLNLTAGHRRGDEVLASTAARLAPILPTGAVAVRSGGDEFGVLLPKATATDAERWAEHARRVLDRPYVLGDGEFRVTVSIGVAEAQPGMGATELVERAEEAVSDAKKAGRDRIEVNDAGSHERHRARSRLIAELAQAAARHELELFFQPIVSLEQRGSGRVSQVEALIRWHRSRAALVMPSRFLGIAEDAGLAGTLDRWAIQSALEAVARWLSGGRDVKVSVNCSTAEFRSHLLEDVGEALALTGVPPDHLRLEIGEDTLFDDHALSVDRVQGLAEIGVEVVLDDFGAGASSLTRLQDLALGGVKVDRGLVLALTTTQGERVYRAVVEIGTAFGLEVTALGVETPRQLSTVRRLGCDLAQGYLLGRAAPEEVVPEHAAYPVG